MDRRVSYPTDRSPAVGAPVRFAEPLERVSWRAVPLGSTRRKRRQKHVVEPGSDIEEGSLPLDQQSRRVLDQLVHRARHASIRRLCESDRGAGRGDESAEDELQPVILHNFTEIAQGAIDDLRSFVIPLPYITVE